MGKKTHQYLRTWVESLLSIGKYGFSLLDLKSAFPEQSDIAIKSALKRLVDKGKIVSIYKGYYLIIPPQYSAQGILPPTLFLDAFMKFLNRPYYLSLLNAAVFHGAGHQRPQEYYVMTNFPVLRPTQQKGLKINYISIKEIPTPLLEQRKTEAGYLTISNAVLTASDLVQFEKRIGGLDRAASVLNELAEELETLDFETDVLRHSPVTVLQRLGYLLEFICFRKDLADSLFDQMKAEKLRRFRIPLKTSEPTKGFSADNRWNVIVNTPIEAEV